MTASGLSGSPGEVLDTLTEGTSAEPSAAATSPDHPAPDVGTLPTAADVLAEDDAVTPADGEGAPAAAEPDDAVPPADGERAPGVPETDGTVTPPGPGTDPDPLRPDAGTGVRAPVPPTSGHPWVFDPGWVLTAQPYRRTGPLLPRAAWFLLVQALDGALDLAGLGDDLRVPAERLMVEGLLAEDGSLTGDGYLVAEILRSPVAMLRVDSMAPGHRGTMEVLLDFDMGVSLATTGPTGSHPLPRDVDSRGVPVDVPDPAGPATGVTGGTGPAELPSPVGLEVFELGWAPATIASWTGTGPGVSWLSEPTTLSLEVLHARLTDAAMLPPRDLPGQIVGVWSDPWLLWELKAWPNGERLMVLRIGHRHPVLLSAGSAGGEARVTLTPVSPYTLWRTLIALVRRALVAGADELR